jgi:hypothetical protein
MTTIFSADRGWHEGSTSLEIMVEVKPLPPSCSYAAGQARVAIFPEDRSTSIILFSMA